MSRLFITGTDTGVGKSVVTAALAASAPGTVAALKPVASGVAPGTAGEDAILLGLGAGHPPRVGLALPLPVSPHRAAAEVGLSIALDHLLAWIQEHPADHVLIEGVGGWAVPLSWTLSVADLAAAVGAPVLVVAADRLGVLNHTLLTVAAIRDRGLSVAGVVLNTAGPVADEDRDARRYHLDDLAALLPGTPLARLGPLGTLTRASLGHAGRGLRTALGL